MGGRQSKPEDAAILVNPNEPPVPINLGPDLMKTLSKPSSEGYSPAEVEKIVRTKLAEQLETITDIESEIRRLEEDTLAREIAERAERMAEEARTISLRLPKAEVLVKERAVLECYARNKDRPLDCWKEFEEFRDIARKAFRDNVSVA